MPGPNTSRSVSCLDGRISRIPEIVCAFLLRASANEMSDVTPYPAIRVQSPRMSPNHAELRVHRESMASTSPVFEAWIIMSQIRYLRCCKYKPRLTIHQKNPKMTAAMTSAIPVSACTIAPPAKIQMVRRSLSIFSNASRRTSQ